MSFSSDNPLQTNQLPISVEFPTEPKLLQVINTETYKRTANAVNTKESGLYLNQEMASFKQYFTPDNPMKNRNVYRKVIDFGALPNTAVKTVAHGIAFDSDSTLVQLYGAATDPTALQYIPLPYSSAAGDPIELSANSTNIRIRTLSDWTSYTRCYVVIEWLKN